MLALRDSTDYDEPTPVAHGYGFRNHTVSPCARFESFDCNDRHYEIDWDEIDLSASDDESEAWHSRVTAELREIIQRLRAERRASFESMIEVSNSVLRDRYLSPCGRFERFQLDGQPVEVDWNEIDPPGTDLNAPGIPHEQVMEEIRLLCEELDHQR